MKLLVCCPISAEIGGVDVGNHPPFRSWRSVLELFGQTHAMAALRSRKIRRWKL